MFIFLIAPFIFAFVLTWHIRSKNKGINSLALISFFLASYPLVLLSYVIFGWYHLGPGVLYLFFGVPGAILAVVFGLASLLQIKWNKLKGKKIVMIGIVLAISQIVIFLLLAELGFVD